MQSSFLSLICRREALWTSCPRVASSWQVMEHRYLTWSRQPWYLKRKEICFLARDLTMSRRSGSRLRMLRRVSRAGSYESTHLRTTEPLPHLQQGCHQGRSSRLTLYHLDQLRSSKTPWKIQCQEEPQYHISMLNRANCPWKMRIKNVQNRIENCNKVRKMTKRD